MTTHEPTRDQNDIAAGQTPTEAGASYSLGGSNPGAAGIGAPKALDSSAPGGTLEDVQHRGAQDEEADSSPPVGAEESGPPGRKRPYGRVQRHKHSIRLSRSEFEQIRQAAAWTGLRPMGFAANAAVTAAQDEESARAGIVNQRGMVHELMRASAQLGWVGNNLNQITRTLNSGGDVITEDLRTCLARVTVAVVRVERAAEQLAGR